MNSEQSKKNADLVMSSLVAQAEAGGIGIVRVKDGELFMFAAQKLRALLEVAEASPDKRCVVFLKMGPELRPQ